MYKKKRMLAVVVEPDKEAVIKEIGGELEDLQELVGGFIQAVYPYEDEVAIILNEDGKIEGLPWNRALRGGDENNGPIYDIISGTFAIVGLGEEDFCSLSSTLAKKYEKLFKIPEMFLNIHGTIAVLPRTEKYMKEMGIKEE